MGLTIIDEARAYWERIRGARSMPARADIDPAEIKRILPHILLLDVAREPLDFYYRLVGTEIDRHSAEKHTGKWISEIPDRAPPSTVWDNLRQVVETRLPSERTVRYVGPLKDFVTTRQIVLPLSNDDREVNMLMVVIAYIKG